MTNPSIEKRNSLQRAKGLMASGDAAAARYAALELRMCLEAMTYQKLNSYAQYLPKSFVARTWQAPQLLKAMKQIDSVADQTMILHMGREVVPGVPPTQDEYQLIGEHRSFTYAWLRKNYNKLGGMLHADAKNTFTDETPDWDYLAEVVAEIERVLEGSILGMTFGETLNFTCGICKEASVASLHYAKTERHVICLNPSCEAEYDIHVEGEQIMLGPRSASFDCKKCPARITIEKRHLVDRMQVQCQDCKHAYEIQFLYKVVPVDRVPGEQSKA